MTTEKESGSTTYLVFYREGTWGGYRSKQRLMPVSWETAVLRGDDPRWHFWDKSGVREYEILAETDDPQSDKEFQRLSKLAATIRRPDILNPFGVKWHQINDITVNMIRKAVEPQPDLYGKVRSSTSSPLLREALTLVMSTPSVNIRSRRFAAAVLGAGGSTSGLETAEWASKFHLSPEIVEQGAREASKSKRARTRVQDWFSELQSSPVGVPA